ncbi:hypothetical protein [Paenibacillus herberti]|uniref:Uncharacterized protein n=1 Tax=Paenibacillus herberti TaxID=1619309 RepID=A0A229P4M1_9BACL|nr:hypothetical protein [Paenibacillus herberti]OXM17202.1 hypothetical protein CGZ75_11510 [Paenibacillus herberti]
MEIRSIESSLEKIRQEILLQRTGNRLPLGPVGSADSSELEARLDKVSADLQELQPLLDQELDRRQRMLGLVSGLYLRNGSLDRSHELSQELDSREGSYLHGMMHRIEGDYSNAKYWFRLAGAHPYAEELQRRAVELVEGTPEADAALLRKLKREPEWNAALFSDLAAASALTGHNSLDTTLLEKLHSLELELLLEHLSR